MSRGTSFDELYSTLGTVLNQVTGRVWWRKGSIQAAPKVPYATLWLSTGEGLQNPEIENVPLDEPDDQERTFREVPWGTLYLECQADFYKSQSGDSALDAAMRFGNSLLLSSRDLDIGVICAISGSARIIDISGIFRADVEARARVIFHLYANVASPAPIGGTNIGDIQSVPFTLTGAADDRVMTVLNTGEIVWTT